MKQRENYHAAADRYTEDSGFPQDFEQIVFVNVQTRLPLLLLVVNKISCD